MSNRHGKHERRGKRGKAKAKRKRDKQWQDTGRMIRRERQAGNEHWWPIDGLAEGEAESAEPEIAEMPMTDI